MVDDDITVTEVRTLTGSDAQPENFQQCLKLDDFEEERRRAEAFETPEQQLKTAIIKYGDVVSFIPICYC